MLLALVAPSLAGVLVNEVLYDSSNSAGDDGYEWVELCNNGSTTVDLTGYQIQSAGSSWTESYTFASGSIAPGAYVLVGYGSTDFPGAFSPNLQNGGSAADGVRLVDASGTAVDTLVYDTPNSSSLTGDDGAVVTSLAATTGADESLGRWPDCTDTNASATDFVVYATPNPAAANVEPPTEGGGGDDTGGGSTGGSADCTGSDGIVINELVYTTDAEWIELYNGGSAAVTLDGWEFEFGTSSFGSGKAIPSGTTLGPGDYLVVGSPGAATKDVELDMDLGNASNADGLHLVCNGAAVDTVIYGSPNEDGWLDDSGNEATSLAPKPGSDQSIQRAPNGVDTDMCGVDFVADVPSPGAENTALPPIVADCDGSDGVVINEFMVKTGMEYVELYNPTGEDLPVQGWMLEFGTSSFSHTAEIPRDTMLPAGGYLVIGSSGAIYKDVEIDLQDLGNASSADGLRLTCGGVALDTVIYGDDNSDAWVDDTGEVATSFAPAPTTDSMSASRTPNGTDTDLSGDDFMLTEPNPGEETPPPPPCDTAGADSLKVNEIMYDPAETDAGNEWIELYNAGSSTISLSGFVVESAKSSWDTAYTFDADATLAAGEYLVVGGEYVDTDYVGDVDLGQGSGADGVRVLDCEGNVLDTVLYGDELEDEIEGDGGSSEVVPDTSEGASLGRYPNGEDSDHSADWHPYATPTPGAANTDPGATSDGPGGPKTGCNKNSAPSGSAPTGGGCSTVLPFGGMEVGLAALALVRRRRRG